MPVRLFTFALIGGSGVLLHFGMLLLLYQGLAWPFAWGQGAATLMAMTSNFFLNNVVTYRDQRLRGWQWLRGWLSFVVVCGIGAVGNVGVASFLFTQEFSWGLAALAGIAVGTVWNYAVTSFYTWNAKRR